ncbi:YihY/virulence factor BrkB family protein [Granulicella sp. S190]|uniref:YihY/virulence factor BrkB family protein n=1 Tax=Granulicella sp. S190 TaxID=1747226 RepID=UPI00131C98BF|nr:YihY/virulence factor BrkB family protein [Granulicella sp. S190]
MRRLLRLPLVLHGTLLRAMRHDSLNLAQSTAYSAMVALFPALIVAAAIISLVPDTTPLRFQFALFFDRILPPDVSPLLQSYFVASPQTIHSTHALSLAAFVSLLGASSVIATIMEGLRRANDLPVDCWTFWQRRLRALLLVPLSLIPFALASVLVVFGHYITMWLALHITPSVRTSVFLFALLLRWGVALTGSIGLTALIYHMGTPMRQSWKRTLPGAFVSTAMWFLATVVFGWYVTRFANYSQVYGSLGAGIALLFWLYIISLCVLCGAEFNAEFHARFFPSHRTHSTSAPPNTLPPG